MLQQSIVSELGCGGRRSSEVISTLAVSLCHPMDGEWLPYTVTWLVWSQECFSCQARSPLAGLESATEGSLPADLTSQGGFAIHCATDAPCEIVRRHLTVLNFSDELFDIAAC
ncbi:hypothetical protein PoB_002211200 [Plakobranchus ocellatus]|uniref:Uncharacterized protein n=1 Tax=Plakobranchus ocellatus TaxID=259542 RepID=A0AAV3ZLS5_9GAST|nr:hypothetical protein PoB_002211200 [Plakobranchus ocellatus]